MSDVVDEIDKLVDESLKRGPVDDYRVNRYDKCWHCGRDFHGLPVTEKIAVMYRNGIFDETYRSSEDRSKILCPGSDFIGPVQAQPSWSDRSRREIDQFGPDASGLHHVRLTTDHRRWWRTMLPSDAHVIFQYETDWALKRIIVEIGDDQVTFNSRHVRVHRDEDREENLSPTDMTGVPRVLRIVLDVLGDNAPYIGGLWEPLTALGVVEHPDDA